MTVGIEPTSDDLTGRCSATELRHQGLHDAGGNRTLTRAQRIEKQLTG